MAKNELRNKLKIWLLSHPKLNPYRFSFKSFFRNSTSTFRVLPDFIIIGSGRAGTTALYTYLIQHPSIFSASTENNESVGDLHFFEYMISDKISWYKSHFPTKFTKNYYKFKSKNNFVTGEYTSTYMYNKNVPKRISKLLPNVKLIICLRDPVKRIVSHLNMVNTYKKKHGKKQRVIKDIINNPEFVNRGKYFTLINNNILPYFDISKIHISIVDEYPFEQESRNNDNTKNLWISDNATALTTYDDINTWDTSLVTNMSDLFSGKTTF